MHAEQRDYRRNVAQRGDALVLLQSLLDSCTPLVFFDPQHRDTLDRLAYGVEDARQKGRALLSAMTSEYVDTCCREAARVLRPSGYLLLWADTFRLCEAYHLRIADVLKCVDLIAWDNGRIGNGYRSRRRGDYLLVLQKQPLAAKNTWRDHSIPSRWIEKVDRTLHPHVKPIGLIKKLIGAVTRPGDLIVDPAAGSFAVMHAAQQLGREFIGCDIAYGFPHSAAMARRRRSGAVQSGPAAAVSGLAGNAACKIDSQQGAVMNVAPAQCHCRRWRAPAAGAAS
jgi:site-specific DNA-methyltransferase (adenine-specific)